MPIHDIRSQYTFAQLRKSDLLNDPLEQFKRWLNEAEKENIRDYNACCIATADTHGQPTVRYVLLRDLDEKGLIFYTNRNSEKAQHILQNPQAEILFFWQEFNRQVRVRGHVCEIERSVIDQYFQSRPIENQQATGASRQSLPINNRADLEQQFHDFQAKNPKFVATPEYWTGFRLQPSYWEFWQGRVHRLHDRLCYRWQESKQCWHVQRLQP